MDVQASNGYRESSSDTFKGHATLYGITLGGYYSPASAPQLILGGRLGYVGATGSVDSTDIVQNGALLAFDIGVVF